MHLGPIAGALRPLAALLVLLLAAPLAAQAPVVSYAGEAMRLASASVSGGGSSWTLTLTMDDDNGNGSLPTSFRRWWHCQVGNLSAGATLNFRVTNAGYTDIILPVWSLSTDGVTFGAYERMPASAVPTLFSSTQHRFSVTVPAGVVAMRVAKFFPYSMAQKNALLQGLAGDPRVRSITPIGYSVQGRAIEKITFTDDTVPDTQKQRVWVHSAIHPAETTAFYMIEGLCDWLTSGALEAEALLDHAIVEVVPMANPDGMVLGNYRTNANSVNLEEQWSAPYTSTQPEIVALRTAIEGYMGTAASPASNPIRVLLNLHSTHNVTYPFHFRHVANAGWSPGCSSCGVLPVVHQAEQDWIDAFLANSPLAALGSTQNSTLGSRPFVESMCHDRWTAQPGWLGAPHFEEPVMAITFEGTYAFGPDGLSWSTDDDYVQVGREMGMGLYDYFGLELSASATPYGAGCGMLLNGFLTPTGGGTHLANLFATGGTPSGLLLWVVGWQQAQVTLPAPWDNCQLLATLDVTEAGLFDPFGAAVLPVPLPAVSGLNAYFQAFSFDAAFFIEGSNGLRLQNDF